MPLTTYGGLAIRLNSIVQWLNYKIELKCNRQAECEKMVQEVYWMGESYNRCSEGNKIM